MRLAIAIKSCHKYAAKAQACRETWVQDVRDWADYFFLLGQPTKGNQPGDALLCEVSDAYADLAPKILCSCQYALNSNIDRMFVCDDDTYVRADRLYMASKQTEDYVGYIRTGGLDWNGNIPYAQGSAYWLSARAMEYIVAAHAEMRPCRVEDGSVGRALIDKVFFTHDYRYYPGPYPDTRPTVENKLITTHKCSPELMRRFYREDKLL